MKNKNENEKEPLKKKEYAKPTVVKHTAASVVVGSCSSYSSASNDTCGLLTQGTYYY